MITATLTNPSTLEVVNMPLIEQDFINTPIERATDVETLDASMYTDFVAQVEAWTFNYQSLTQAQYDALRAVYDNQFTNYVYPLLSIPFYGLEDQPVRMYINEKNIWNNCGDVQNAVFNFRETPQLPEGS